MSLETTTTSRLVETTPISLADYKAPDRVGLIIVDEVNGFCTVGCGPLAPAAPNPQVDRMIRETDALARSFVAAGNPVLAFLDTHTPGRAEPPYPPHCEVGTGQENLVPQLEWLESDQSVTILRKDVINGVVGGIQADGRNVVFDWIVREELEAVIVQGICTDICVLDAVVTLLSARNHYINGKPMLGSLKDIVVHEPGCATYDLPLETARQLGLPDTSAHPQAEAHHIGLWVMQARGAILARSIS